MQTKINKNTYTILFKTKWINKNQVYHDRTPTFRITSILQTIMRKPIQMDWLNIKKIKTLNHPIPNKQMPK